MDVVNLLTGQPSQRGASNYWAKLKQRLKEEGFQLLTNCQQLKLKAPDGKRRLTDEIARAWSGMTTRQYKNLKVLKKESLRDNMSTSELVLNMLAGGSAKEISQTERPEGFEENRDVAQRGGTIAGDARKAIERQNRKPQTKATKRSYHPAPTIMQGKEW